MNIEELTTAEREEALDVLCAAFREYPAMRFVIGHNVPDYDTQLRKLIGFYCDKRFVNGWPVLGTRHDGNLVAVALISEPARGPLADLTALEADLRSALDEAVLDRMARFEQASDANEPPGPHHMVGMLAVRPGHQGMGYGKALLRRATELSVEFGSAGVTLSTEDPPNVPLYEHLGFEVVAQADVDAVHSWFMRWPNPSYDP